ncbi:LipA and NB-ARC domain-containing protein [Verticillium alfalfae VaMs.102]|uniref:LipA and NB-ARC domain-containing protein n=1 Tax=Verticillium alfalfae (strain VaMs.102 / ATCC MYA-4576 / FGSC 10136) TaxID=526221 RepID=C9SXY9_VERA1|nr:LipA and NB-ARC domain-containing protein [Verticillium alfalfae VaMs.102]EEY23654.1 LipA and NB-ARC domain-containing protein [Verticillium alfalfae VaMs.102]
MVDREEIPRDGITCVFTHPDAQADIVFLHGLNGNPTRTWTAKDSAVYWPIDLLPNTLGPDAPVDVLVYGYNADTASTSERSASDNYIYEPALPSFGFYFLPRHEGNRNETHHLGCSKPRRHSLEACPELFQRPRRQTP